ncbi:uncharacterized protein BX663DRAFT_492385 [Cokeromyces recurvatus]|uniref:uncharacterized protein n=1 Tax=Cokeromyces recurvatus TaxID=90255 RepID=UPI00221F43EB|nr:uncharacterized protein BX663DRAFT_492385 [Cokeromyces recurvatus]KAI7907912.1 hypothetical protein BX663DRAFT_492385 [Cokeromyces recurvatus]
MTGSIHQTYDHQVVTTDGGEYYHNTLSNEHNGLRTDEFLEEYTEKAPPPQKRKFYKKKKYWIICSIISVIIIVVLVILILFVIFPKIAQSLMNKSKIDVTAAGISFNKPDSLANSVYSKRNGDDMNSTFYMSMESDLSHTGPFHAKLKFHNPVEIYYNETHLGDIFIFNGTSIAGGKGKLNAVTPFLIRNQAAFASFSKTMLAVEQFKWTLKGKLDITALSRTATVNLNKEITLNGMNGFPNVKITSFQLPGDDPNGGILVELGTILESPSPIGVQLGTISMAIGYDGVPLGTVVGTNVNLAKGENQILLKGTLQPHNDTVSLAKIGTLFSNYVAGKLSNTTAVGLSSAPDGVNPVGWLSEAFKSVSLNVGLTAGSPLNIINSVSMGYLDLKFDAASPYSPVINAPAVTAGYKLPFGFSLNITEVSQNITLAINTTGANTENFAIMQTPFVPAVTNPESGTIVFGLANTALAGISGKESFYNQYTYSLTASNNYTFMIAGNASTKTNTPIGPIVLTGINFVVPTSLKGLQFLNSSATVINSLDVTGGTTTGLNLGINVTMANPSDFGINTGDVSFNMGASDVTLGLVTLNNLTLNRGENTVAAIASFDPKSSDVGQNLLSTFIMGADNAVDITGHPNSTSITSLAQALSVVSLSSTLPGLKTALIQGASMSVLPDTLTTSMVGIQVTIANPFTAGLSISKVISAATFLGMPVGNIDQDISSNPFIIPGKSAAKSQTLLMSMNLEPAAVALLLRTLAVQANMDTAVLDALLNMGGFSIEGRESITPDSSVFSNFNISDYVLNAMKALKVDLSLSSTTAIGEYVNDLAFSQADVAVAVDNSVTALIPIVGHPIVQQIVDGSVLGFSAIVMSSVTEDSFKVQMKGSVANTGPMDAVIKFPSPLTIAWKGKKLGTTTMADIQAKADVGATFDTQGTFTVTDKNAMAEFAAYMINNDSFEWEITSADVAVEALGFTFTGITLHKYVTLAGANGFKDAVTISSFTLPSDAPNNGGIILVANTVIKNPSQVGFNLGGAGFETYFGNILLGPLASDGAANFAPQASSSMVMKGLLIPQENAEGIKAITTVFGHYLAGQPSTLTVKGASGSGDNGEVSWLTSAFKTIKIENVILPGPETIPELIPSVEMKDMTLDFTKDVWNPPISSSRVEAQLKNPFGFSLGVSQLDMKVKATYHGGLVATLDVPASPATTDASGLITTSFNNIPFKVADRELFTGFNSLLTLTPEVVFGLNGTSNAIAKTAVGTLSLPGVTFDVDTHLAGFNSFGGVATITDIKVTGAASHYIKISLTTQFNNPSNITISIGDINFNVQMPQFGNTNVGKAYLNNVVIVPGVNTFSTEMHLGEGATNLEAMGTMLTSYLTGAAVPLTIAGAPSSSTIPPVQQALSQLKLSTTMNGIKDGLIKHISVYSDILSIYGGEAQADVTLYNPLEVPFTVVHIKADCHKVIKCTVAGNVGENRLVGSIDYELASPLTIPPKSTATAGPWPVKIDNGADIPGLLATFADMDLTYNVTQNASVIIDGAFSVSNMYYYQQNTPYTLTIPLLTDEMTQEEFLAVCYSPPASVTAAMILNNDTTNSTNTTTTTTTATATATTTTTTLTPINVSTTTSLAEPATQTEVTITTTTEAAAITTTTEAAEATTTTEVLETEITNAENIAATTAVA